MLMSCDYCEIEQLQKSTAEANCKSELQNKLQKRTAKVNCRNAVELQNEPQAQNGAGVYLRATVSELRYIA